MASIYDALGWGIKQPNNYNRNQTPAPAALTNTQNAPAQQASTGTWAQPQQAPQTQTGGRMAILDPAKPLQLSASGPGVQLGATAQRTGITKDPWQDFLYNTVLGASQGNNVPGYTTDALQSLTNNPAVAANFFPQLAKPLLEANRASQDVQTRNTTDAFRKAGGTGGGALQSGAFAQAGRQLAGDFARQDQEVLAKTYTPLTEQLSRNQLGAIHAGLNLPQAQNVGISNLIPLATRLSPLGQATETLSAGTGAAPPQVPQAPGFLRNPGYWG